MANSQSTITTDDSKPQWHSWIIKSAKHTSKQDKPEREIIAFSTAFALDNEQPVISDLGNKADEFLKWLLPLIIVCSLTANLIMIRIMHSLSQWKFPPCLYIVILSSLELLNNMVKIIDKWCQIMFSVRFLDSLILTSHAVCSTFTISLYLIIHMIGFIRSAMCIDIYYSYKKPLSNTRKVVISRIHHLLLLFTTLLLIINSHFLWTYSIMHMNNKQTSVPPGNYCTYLVKWVNPTFRDIVWPLVDFSIGELCPILSIVICLILTYITISKQSSKDEKRSISNSSHNLSRHLIDVHTFLEMRKVLMVYNIITLILVLLPSAFSMLYKTTKYQLNHAMKLVTTYSIVRSSNRSYITPMDITIFDISIYCLAMMSSVCNVIMSFIMSPNGFRKEFKSTFFLSKKTSKINYQI